MLIVPNAMTHRWLLACLCLALGACADTASPPASHAREAAAASVSVDSEDELADATPSTMPAPAARDLEVDPAQTEADRRDMLTLAADIATQGDARALALAAALRNGALGNATENGGDASAGIDATVESWLDDAMARGPDDVTAIVLALYLDFRDTSRRRALIARWRTLEPGNMVPMMLASLPEGALFDAAASADRYDSHYDDALRATLEILARSRSPALARLRAGQWEQGLLAYEMTMAMAYHAASVTPGFSGIVSPCKSDAMDPGRKQQCRRIAGTLLDNADALIAEMIGAAMAKRLAASPAEHAGIEARQRELAWLSACLGAMTQIGQKAVMSRYAEILLGSTQITERRLMRRLVIEGGLPPTPPADWTAGDSVLLAPRHDRQAAGMH